MSTEVVVTRDGRLMCTCGKDHRLHVQGEKRRLSCFALLPFLKLLAA